MNTRICLLSLATVVLLGTTTFADGPFDKFLPRGRLLRKLRDDFVGQPKPAAPTPAAKPNLAGQKGPTPATQQRSTAAQQRAGSAQQRAAATRQANADRPSVLRSGPEAFGMAIVVDKSDNLVVAQVAANGNAAAAGIQRGDVLVEAGGVELSAIEEFEQIAKILGAGDQVELKVARSGRTAKVMLQHGQPPSLEDVDSGKVSVQNSAASRSERHQSTSSKRAGYRDDFSFVPPSDDISASGMQSVVERPTAPARAVSTQKPALSQLQSNYRPQASSPSQQPVAQQQQIQVLREQLEQLRRQQNLIGSGVRAQ